MAIFTMTEAAYIQSRNEYEGRCVGCGAIAYDCEPDARKYTCEECGESQVFGVEELLIMGHIAFGVDRKQFKGRPK